MGGTNSDSLIIDIVDFFPYIIPLICVFLLLRTGRFGNRATQRRIDADTMKSATKPV